VVCTTKEIKKNRKNHKGKKVFIRNGLNHLIFNYQLQMNGLSRMDKRSCKNQQAGAYRMGFYHRA
jgi:hypothetical protein